MVDDGFHNHHVRHGVQGWAATTAVSAISFVLSGFDPFTGYFTAAAAIGSGAFLREHLRRKRENAYDFLEANM